MNLKYTKWVKKNCNSLVNKTILVTGSNTGIGFQLARYICYLQGNLILAVRNSRKGDEALNTLKEEFPNVSISLAIMDVSEKSSIDKFISSVKSSGLVIDGIVNNAGVYLTEFDVTSENRPATLATNYYGPYLLIGGFQEFFSKDARIINVTSIIARQGKVTLPVESKQNDKYKNSKLLLLSFSKYLSKYYEDKGYTYKVYACHPGVAATNIIKPFMVKFKDWIKKIGTHILRMFTHSPEKASLSLLLGLAGRLPSGTHIGPRVFQVTGYPKAIKYYKNVVDFEHSYISGTNKTLGVEYFT